jgi:Ner family transcriptional regulator
MIDYSFVGSLSRPPIIMDAIEINYRLRRLGKTQTGIAKDLGVRGGVVSNVIHNRATAHAVAQHIAGLLDMRVEEIWPNRYVFKPRATKSRAPMLADPTAHEEGHMT